ncbi:hypothetical protein ILYODFUR_011466 [Ilyodon furcidens]|uniref:Uncharacterized protein n=1 Tax=Ilyodon furcidens TaxID=33524 RepID=A0ABV0TAW7_9TELE
MKQGEVMSCTLNLIICHTNQIIHSGSPSVNTDRMRNTAAGLCHSVVPYMVEQSSYPSGRMLVVNPVLRKISLLVPVDSAASKRDQSTGTNQTGTKPGQVPARPAPSLAPQRPENG